MKHNAETFRDYALIDRDSAECLLRNGDEYSPTVCSLSQQFTEKIIKGKLVEFDCNPPFSHNIGYLLSLFSKHTGIVVPDEIIILASELTDLYITMRYPGDEVLEYDSEDGQWAFETANKVVDWIDGFHP